MGHNFGITMKNRIILIVSSFLLTMSMALTAKADFGFFEPNELRLSCDEPFGSTTLIFIPGAPNGNYNANVSAAGFGSEFVIINDGTAGFPAVFPFNIPDVEQNGILIPISLDTEQLEGNSFFDINLDILASPNDEETIEAGFGLARGQLIITDDGCLGSRSPPDEEPPSEPVPPIEDALVDVEMGGFEAININDAKAEENNDLSVVLNFKLDKAIFDLISGSLKEGEDIKDKLIGLAEKFGVKFDFKKLKKLARKELKDAAKGKKGKERDDAIKEAKEKGFNKLVSVIRMKLPPIPPKRAPEFEKEKARKIRKAKKKKILEALEIKVGEITDGEKDGKAVKCVSLTLTLPGKVCEAKEKGKKKASVIASEPIGIATLEPGESVSVEIPIKVVGFFQQFFGEPNKKGEPDGNVEASFTVENPLP